MRLTFRQGTPAAVLAGALFLGCASAAAAPSQGVRAGPAASSGILHAWSGTITVKVDATQGLATSLTLVGSAVFTVRGSEPPVVRLHFVLTEELLTGDPTGCPKVVQTFDLEGSVDAHGLPIVMGTYGPYDDGHYSIRFLPIAVSSTLTQGCPETARPGAEAFEWRVELPPGSASPGATELRGSAETEEGSPYGFAGTLSWDLTRAGEGGGSPPPPPVQTFTDTFTAPGQAKPHAVTIPAATKTVDLTIRWPKAGDAFDAAGFVVVRGGKIVARSPALFQAEPRKLKITKLKITKTSVTIRVSRLVAGKLKFKVVAKKVSGTTKVTTRVKRR